VVSVAADVLTKGGNVALLHRSAVEQSRLQAVVRWSDSDGAEVDVAALLLGPDGRVRSDEDFVFYNAPSGGDGAVRLLGKRTGDDVAEDRVAVDLEALPSDVEKVVILASLDAADGVGFGDVGDLALDVVDAGGESRAHFDIAGAGSETAMVLGELYLRGEQWKFRAVGQGWDSGLAGLATDYGIDVEDPSDSPSDFDGPLAGSAALAVRPETAVDESVDASLLAVDMVEALAVVDVEESAPQVAEADHNELAAATAEPSTIEPMRRRSGVRTRKKRTTASTLPPLTLAVDPSWQPARLFSIIGVGNPAEQERRATSSLLSTMMAVREFGRALVARFGGPAGVIETYLEVPFKLDDRTSIPDGVIRVARGGRIWTALLEVKTGTSPLRNEQVERYLDLARQQGYDAVITLSNDLAPVGGAHPVTVDGRKLRKVSLHHISWSEVLHEAQMQLAHRGVQDRVQAWLLAELIRYLQHPRSGAAGFDDMGAAWVPVRESVAANTLRATDTKVAAVTASWDKLIRFLCLQMTSQLGVTVTPVVARKLARDPLTRTLNAAEELARAGTLSAVLRIPGAAGPVSVVADLRMAQIRTTVQLEAPPDGTGLRRINWIIRQLSDAPDSVAIEVLFARREHTSCEQLKDARVKPVALLPDPTAEIRAFRLTACAPMGTKRNGLSKAFVPSVIDAVDAFYARILQGLRPPAPRMPADVAAEAIDAVERAVDA
jgi:stress response protein SCP2